MWRPLCAAVLCVTLASVVTGCEPRADAVADKYAVMTDEYVSRSFLRSVSALVAIDETGELNVCVEITGAAAAPDDYEARIRAAVQHAVGSWNDLLNQPPPPDTPDYTFPPWTRESVTINFTCSGSRVYHVYGDTSNERAYARIDERTMRLDTSCTWNDSRLRTVVAHEYGHLMGLSDTYTEPEIGLDVYGQPASLMNGNWWFTDDDRAGVWNLWRYLVYGGDPCGPGYDVQAENMWGTYCILSEDDGGGGTGCDVECDDYDVTPGQCFPDASGALWECDDDGCLNRVYECSDDSDVPTCDMLCSWYGVEPGGCITQEDGSSWECDSEGCLHRVESCGDDDEGSTVDCQWECSDYGQSPGDCYTDRNGNSWECDADGCLQFTSACPGESDTTVTCTYDGSDYGQSPGDCYTDRNGNSWACDDDGCLNHVTSCPEDEVENPPLTCTYDCADYGQSPGDCYTDRNGNSWRCDANACLEHVSSCW